MRRKPVIAIAIAIAAIAVAAILVTARSRTRSPRVAETGPAPSVATPAATEPLPEAAAVPSPSTAVPAPPPASAAPAPASSAAPSSDAAAPASLGMRIGLGEAFERVSSGSVYVLDVRDLESYRRGHVPGAMHIPLPRVESELPYLPRDKPILTYCT